MTAPDDRARDEQPAVAECGCGCQYDSAGRVFVDHCVCPDAQPAPAGDDELREAIDNARYASELDENTLYETVRVLAAGVREQGRELERLHTWAGLMSLLAEHYPPDTFTGESGDPGSRIIALTRELEQLREENASLRETLEILSDSDTVTAILEGETDAELTALRALDEKAAAVVRAAEGLHLDWVLPEFRELLNELARAHEDTYDPAFPQAARKIGGSWSRATAAWVFDARDAARVRDLRARARDDTPGDPS